MANGRTTASVARPRYPHNHRHGNQAAHPLPYDPSIPLQPRKHDPASMVEVVSSTICSAGWKPDKELWPEVSAWVKDWDRYWRDTSFVTRGIKLLSKLFFLQELPKVEFEWSEEVINKHGSYGLTVASPDGKSVKMKVSMDPRDWHERLRVRDAKSAFFGTLLHEICHAGLEFWSCDGERGCKTKGKCVAMHIRELGKTGHGSSWVLLAACVEAAAKKLFPELEVRLGVVESVGKERAGGHLYISTISEWRIILNKLKEKDVDELLRYAHPQARKDLFGMHCWEDRECGYFNDSAACLRYWLSTQRWSVIVARGRY